MKYINTSTRTLVDFPPGGQPVPVYFLFQGRRLKVDRVIQVSPSRKTFRSCITYRCTYSGKALELRWDRERNRWFIDRIEIG